MAWLAPLSAALLIVLSPATRAHEPPQVPRDPGRPAPAGTASIHGRVVRADTAQPIRWASITLQGGAGRALVATTDAEGRYRFESLPAGRYVATAAKAGFVALPFGARSAGRLPVPIVLAERQTIEADFALPPGAAVEGRIFSAEGEPLQNVNVQASRYAYGAGIPRIVAIGRPARTDDRGFFRLHSLPRGEYFIQVSPELGPPAAEGDEIIQRPRGFATTYYPGTARLNDALRVALSAGQTQHVECTVANVPLASVAVQVSDSSGRVPASVGAVVQYAGGIVFASRGVTGRSDLLFTNVPPGDYRVIASARTAGSDPEFAAIDLRVSGQDISAPIRTVPGATITGRVETEAGAPASAQGGLPIVAINASLPPVPGDPNVMMSPARTDANGQFQFRGLFGARLFRVQRLMTPWVLKSVLLDGRDITDVPTEIRPAGTPPQLRVIVTNRTGAVSGSVSRAGGGVVPESRVVIFAADEERWGVESRFIKASPVAIDGGFAVDGLLPGEYLVAAAEEIAEGAWTDPRVLRELRKTARQVRVKPLATETVHLTLPKS